MENNSEFQELSPTTVSKLAKVGIHSIADLESKTKKEVKALKGIGHKCMVEIEFLLVKRKKKFKPEPKKYTSDVSLRRKIIQFFIKNTSKINWAIEMRNADRLLNEYPQEFIFTINPRVEVRTLNYLFNPYVKGELDKRYNRWKTPDLTTKIVEDENVEILDFKIGEDKVINKPQTLKDFLS